jgi:DnaJ-class molecular chaperone
MNATPSQGSQGGQRCAACGGTGTQDDKACPVCGGYGTLSDGSMVFVPRPDSAMLTREQCEKLLGNTAAR